MQPSVKTDEAALVAHGQTQEVAVGNLPVSQQVLPKLRVSVQQAVVVSQKACAGWAVAWVRRLATAAKGWDCG